MVWDGSRSQQTDVKADNYLAWTDSKHTSPPVGRCISPGEIELKLSALDRETSVNASCEWHTSSQTNTVLSDGIKPASNSTPAAPRIPSDHFSSQVSGVSVWSEQMFSTPGSSAAMTSDLFPLAPLDAPKPIFQNERTSGSNVSEHDSIQAAMETPETPSLTWAPANGGTDGVIPFEDYASKYELRPQSGKAGFGSTWLDQDETGDYDPTEERRKLKARRTKPKPQPRERECEDDMFDSKDEEEVNSETASRDRLQLLVQLNFSSEAGKASFRRHVNELPARTEPSTDEFATYYKLRKKSLATVSHSGSRLHRARVSDTQAPRSATAPTKKRAAREPLEQRTPTKQPKNATQSAGTEKKITTKFCHPIIFNYEDTDGSKSCNFCGPNSCAILGLEAKEVEVIDWVDGHGLTEVSGGHMASGAANTRMCMDCTMQRMPAIACPKHDMHPMPGVSQETVDVDGALMALFSGEQRIADRWCSICPSLAFYECEDGTEVGCGLSLCEHCMLSLTGVYDGDLQMMLTKLEDDPSEARPLGLRADAEFLKQDGLLMRYVLWSTQ
ncbi:hypothetical protein LTR08_000386 [Meristemomyces frigidus]|nr:hypothetical protein LTR08_000386 [Meristemomyces frigidus]